MLNIPNELKNIYRDNIQPYNQKLADIQVSICFPELDLTIGNSQIADNRFKINEKLCSTKDITFGSCEASSFNVTVADVTEDLKGKTCIVSQSINGIYTMPLGIFTVESAKKQDNKRFKDIVAYDSMKKFDVDVIGWYNSLTFPTTLKQFRISLCNHLGIEYEDSNLPNDNMTVEKTVDTTELIGRDALKCCEELNGCFGQIGREGKLKHVVLPTSVSEEFYPNTDIRPQNISSYEYIEEMRRKAKYKSLRQEEYTVKAIDKVQIRQEEGDIGAIAGTGTNTYIIEGNFLVFGKSAEELNTIANNVYQNIANRPYRPLEVECIGLPYLEVGDCVSFNGVTSFIFERELSGVQSLTDEYKATGNEERTQTMTLNKEIIQLKGKTNILKRSVDETKSEIIDLEENTASMFRQTADEIALKVSKDNIINEINVSNEGVAINATKLDLNGYTTINGNFSIDLNGSARIKNGTFEIEEMLGSDILRLQMVGALLNIGIYDSQGNVVAGSVHDHQKVQFINGSGSNETIIGRGWMSYRYNGVTYMDVYNGSFVLNNVVLTNTSVNGGVPITNQNYDKGTYLFPPAEHTHTQYASSSHSHSNYASSNHSHSGYASSSHNHDSDYCSWENYNALQSRVAVLESKA